MRVCVCVHVHACVSVCLSICLAHTKGELIALIKFLCFTSWVRGERGRVGSEEGRQRVGDWQVGFRGEGELQSFCCSLKFSYVISGMRGRK